MSFTPSACTIIIVILESHNANFVASTPWLTTRRRTCPICKGDVVRPSNPSSTEPHLATPRQSDDDIQRQAAESTNESPSSAIPIPRDALDLERGDGAGSTLVTNHSEESLPQRGWRDLASFSLSAFSGEAAWRQALADRTR